VRPLEVASRLLHLTGISALSRRVLTAGRRFAIVLHGVSSRFRADLPVDAQPYTTVDDLESILRWLKERFDILTTDEFLYSSKPGILVTFDDGYANNHSLVLPVLRRMKVPAVFFVTLQHVRDPRDWLPSVRRVTSRIWSDRSAVPAGLAAELFDGMSRQQLADCFEDPLITVASHTMSHPFLTRCDDTQLRQELTQSRRLLEEWSGAPVELIAYPTSDYDERVVRAANGCGYRAAFAESSRHVGVPPMEIPRIGIYAADEAYLAAKFSGLHGSSLRGALLQR
jgi:peptidoglycan/xylan/chitin deacetylase (PgdA/CDA1 family)